MPSSFAQPPREPAGPRELPAVLQNNGGTAAGSVGVAVPLSLRRAWPLLFVACLASGGCADACRSPYFTWRLKPLRVAAAEPDLKPSTPRLP